jgi:hypothetical protein
MICLAEMSDNRREIPPVSFIEQTDRNAAPHAWLQNSMQWFAHRGTGFGGTITAMKPKTETTTASLAVVGVAIGKEVFHLVGLNTDGQLPFAGRSGG